MTSAYWKADGSFNDMPLGGDPAIAKKDRNSAGHVWSLAQKKNQPVTVPVGRQRAETVSWAPKRAINNSSTNDADDAEVLRFPGSMYPRPLRELDEARRTRLSSAASDPGLSPKRRGSARVRREFYEREALNQFGVSQLRSSKFFAKM